MGTMWAYLTGQRGVRGVLFGHGDSTVYGQVFEDDVEPDLFVHNCSAAREFRSSYSSGSLTPAQQGKQELIAWHEMGHAKVGKVTGLKVLMMTADGVKETGLTTMKGPEPTLYDHLMICAAGQAGAMRYYTAYGFPPNVAREMATEGNAGDFDDYLSAGGDPRQWNKFVTEAYKIIRRYDRAVERNATKLAERGRRSGAGV